MKPNFVFFANFSNLIDGVNGSLNCGSHGCIDQHANIVFFDLFLNTFLQFRGYHSSWWISLDIDKVILADSTKVSSFFHWIMRGFRGEYFKGLISITFGLGTGFYCIPWGCDGHKIGKRAAWCKYPVKILPFKKPFHQVINFEFHERETGCQLISINRAIDSGAHHGAKNRVLIEATK